MNPYKRFTALLIGLMITSAFVLSFVLFISIERNVLKETKQVTSKAVDIHFQKVFSQVFDQGDPMKSDQVQLQDNYNRLKNMVAMHFDLYSIEETDFIRKDGLVYFSYNQNKVGEILPVKSRLKDAFQNELQVNRTGEQLLEMWIPILGANGEVREVAYVQRDISDQVQSIQIMQLIAIGAILIIFAILFLSLRQVFKRSTKQIHKKNDELNELLSSLEHTYDASLQALSAALDLRDNETEGHCLRVTAYTVHLSKKLEVEGEKLLHIARGALLHDIGKIGIPDSILLKPGPLTDDEWEIMKTHVSVGQDMLGSIAFLEDAMSIIRYHHERWDGNGYMHGLKGEEIPFEARIFALCDTYDAMTSDRPYRKGMTHEEAVAEIQACRGTQLDPTVVDAFLQIPKEDWLQLQYVPVQDNQTFSLKHLLAS